MTDRDPELAAMSRVVLVLEELDPVIRARVLRWVVARFGESPRLEARRGRKVATGMLEAVVDAHNAGNTMEDIARSLGVAERTVYRYMTQARERGLIAGD
jgi:AcrR family transcriptional regulator